MTVRFPTAALMTTLFATAITWGPLAPNASALTCGEWRWPVKTLSDNLAKKVNYHPVNKTVDYLRGLAKPSGLTSTTPRMKGTERKTFRVKVQVVTAVVEDDHDIHLVIAMKGAKAHHMIVEFPDVKCNGAKSSAKKAAMARARKSFTKACGTVGTDFVTLHGKATVTGAGFFDEIHGQTGVAPNGIELHPVLSFKSADCHQ